MIELTKEIKDIIDKRKNDLIEISTYIYNHPELGGEEYKCSQFLAEKLKEEGFNVSFPYKDLPTAFVAEAGPENGVTFGFLAEYDALPGYKTPTGNGHACGHNWIAATMCGCAMVLKPLAEKLNMRVVVFGTPAEETFGGKVIMAEQGAFDKVDVALQAHLEAVNIIDSRALAMNSLEIIFKGRAAHAASYPEEGINALDGVQLTFTGINALRQHVRQDVRIHGIVTDGGLATNIVPERAACQITLRAKDKAYLKYVRKRVLDCAQGAALMSGATMEFNDFENPYDDLINVPSLVKLGIKNLNSVGINEFLSADEAPPPGSSDVGNVSYICPTMYAEVALESEEPLKVHDEEALQLVNSEFAFSKMFEIIQAYTQTCVELAWNKKLLLKIKEEHKKLINK